MYTSICIYNIYVYTYSHSAQLHCKQQWLVSAVHSLLFKCSFGSDLTFLFISDV